MKTGCLIILLVFGRLSSLAQPPESSLSGDQLCRHWVGSYYVPGLKNGDTLTLWPGPAKSSVTFKKSGTIIYKKTISTYSGDVIKAGRIKGKWTLNGDDPVVLVLDFPLTRIELRLLECRADYIMMLVFNQEVLVP